MEHRDPIQRLMQVDLNLLVVLRALFETQSTVKTAARIGRTQSAVSLALNRLRHTFNDPLFVREGQGLKPTPIALQLETPVQRLLADSARLFDIKQGFDPATTRRKIVLGFPELAFHQMLTLHQHLLSIAPHISLDLIGMSLQKADYGDGDTALLSGEIDLLLSFYRSDVPQGLQVIGLPSQTWFTLYRPGLDIDDPMSCDQWLAYPHIQVTSGKSGRNPLGDLLSAKGMKRDVGLRTNSFFQALYAAQQTDMLLNVMGPIVLEMAHQFGLKAQPAPIEIPAVSTCLIVRQTQFDPMSAWLAQQAKTIFEQF